MAKDPKKNERTWTEQIEVTGGELVDRVKEVVKEGNVRRLIIRTPNNEALIEIPLTAGVAVGGAMVLFLPVLAALGAIAALLAKVKVDIVHTEDDDE